MTLTDLLIPTYRNMLRTLLGLLDKAEVQLGAGKAEALLSARLAPDMWPLATQLRFAAAQAIEAPQRLRGDSRPAELDEIVDEGRNAGEHPGTLAEARARIDQALAYLDALDEYALDAAPEDQPIVLDLPMGLTFDLTRAQFPATGRSANSTSTSWPPTRSSGKKASTSARLTTCRTCSGICGRSPRPRDDSSRKQRFDDEAVTSFPAEMTADKRAALVGSDTED